MATWSKEWMTMTNSSRDQRIQVLKDILLRLHHGASPDSVEADFQAHFSDVSPIEVSLMEHELMNGDHGVSRVASTSLSDAIGRQNHFNGA